MQLRTVKLLAVNLSGPLPNSWSTLSKARIHHRQEKLFVMLLETLHNASPV